MQRIAARVTTREQGLDSESEPTERQKQIPHTIREMRGWVRDDNVRLKRRERSAPSSGKLRVGHPQRRKRRQEKEATTKTREVRRCAQDDGVKLPQRQKKSSGKVANGAAGFVMTM